MIVDLGTGDGRAVLARASADPGALVIGVDANAAGMTESSRRASRPRTAVPNAWFLAVAVEALPGPLAVGANLVTATLPWGSLLRGVLGCDAFALGGIASIVAPGGRVEALVSVVANDRVEGVETLEASDEPAIAAAWRSRGFELVCMCRATSDDLRAAYSSWARRLQDRPIWRLELRRLERKL